MEQKRFEATVTQINNYIKALLEKTPVIQNIWIKGEISNLKLHSSGHIYLTLKDEGAVLRAVMFRANAARLNFKPENGVKVSAHGRIGVFERDGQYQLYIDQMDKEGKGDLYALFEELKKKLGKEGLFDEKAKKPIPQYPERVGIVTSPTGAAVRDVINVLRRRYPIVKAMLYPVLVQGPSASASIVKAIEFFNKEKKADVLIVGRGGGSIEDLWAFNEEPTVRAVFASEIPVISAVGHETDFTLCDFAADLRAPTPSAAAELAVPDADEIRTFLKNCRERCRSLLENKVIMRRRQLELLSERASFTGFERKIENMMQETDRSFDSLLRAYRAALDRRSSELAKEASRLDALSPLKVFDRGYSVAQTNGRVLRSVEDVKKGDEIVITLTDGLVTSEVTRTERSGRYDV